MLKLGRKPDGEKYSAEELTEVSLEDVKKMVEEQIPGAFAKKAAPKKAAAKKTATKKAAPKKSGASKTKKK